MVIIQNTNEEWDVKNTPTYKAVRRTLRALFEPDEKGRVVELRIFGLPRQGTVSGYYTDLDALAKDATECDGKGAVTVTLNEINPALIARSANKLTPYAKSTTSDKEVDRRRFLFLDFDARRPANISATDTEYKAAKSRAKAVALWLREEQGWPEPFVGDSGNGCHLLYRVDLPNNSDADTLTKTIMAGLSRKFSDAEVEVDESCSNAARLIKLWGTLACKGDSTSERPHRRSEMMYVPPNSQVVSVELLRKLAGTGSNQMRPPQERTTQTNAVMSTLTHKAGMSFDLAGFIAHHDIPVRRIEQKDMGTVYHLEACPFNGAHAYPDAMVCQKPEGAVLYKCLHNSCREKGWREFRLHFAPSAYDEGRDSGRALDKPVVQVTDRELCELTDECLDILRAANDPPFLFQSDGKMARIKEKDEGAEIETLDRTSLRGIMSQCARFERTSANAKTGEITRKAVFPSQDVIADVLTRGYYPDLPILNGIVGNPVFDRDGNLSIAEGYMPSLRLWCTPPDTLDIADIPCPTEGERDKALAFYRHHLYDGFPFSDPASFAHTMAATLLPLMREMVQGPTPLHTITAPTRGTGKTKLVETMIALSAPTGLKPFTAASSEDENQKRLTTYMRQLPVWVFLDNLEGRFASESFCAALTNTRYSARILGSSQEVSVPVRATFVATANNVELHRDIASRSIEIRLDANMERPELRTGFIIGDPPTFVKEHRGRVLTYAYVLIRWWINQGCPRYSGQRKTRFGAWEETMGGLLQSLGIEGFLGNLELSQRNADPEHEAWCAFVESWREQYPVNSHLTCANKLLPLAFGRWDMFGKHDGAGLLTPLHIIRDEARAKQKLGYELKRKADAIFGGYKIVRTDNMRVSEWRLLKVSASTKEGSGDPPAVCPITPLAPLEIISKREEVDAALACPSDDRASAEPL